MFGLPFAASLLAFAPKSEADLPACCRRTGQHHCIMNMAESDGSGKSGFFAPVDKCPCCPAALRGIDHRVNFVPSPTQTVYAELIRHPAGVVQTECKLRISRDRARGKRGPPAFFL